jgi:hypothetical protein
VSIALYELETSVLKSIYRGIEKKHETEQTKVRGPPGLRVFA